MPQSPRQRNDSGGDPPGGSDLAQPVSSVLSERDAFPCLPSVNPAILHIAGTCRGVGVDSVTASGPDAALRLPPTPTR